MATLEEESGGIDWSLAVLSFIVGFGVGILAVLVGLYFVLVWWAGT